MLTSDRRPSLCLATSYDAGFADIGSYCAVGLHLYAARWNCEVHVATGITLDRPPAWHRVQLIPELFDRGHDFVLWIDADAIFTRFDVDILAEVRPDKDLYLVEHAVSAFSGSKVPNTGVMLVRNCEWTRDLFRKIWSMSQYLHHPLWENAALIDLLGYRNLLGLGNYRPNEDMLARIGFLDEAWNFLPDHSQSDAPIIRHYAGVSNDVRRSEMPKDAARACRTAIGDPDLTPLSNDAWQARSDLAALQRLHEATLTSHSWRITAPVRRLSQLLKHRSRSSYRKMPAS